MLDFIHCQTNKARESKEERRGIMSETKNTYSFEKNLRFSQRCGRICTTLFLACAFSICHGAELKRGDTGAVIIIADTPTPTAKYAAKELQTALKRVFAMDASIVPEKEAGKHTSFRFLVGPLKSCPLPDGLGNDCFVIDAPDSSSLRLAGVDNEIPPLTPYYKAFTGTLYAVYRFMHDKLGVRMLWPGESGIVYPEKQSISTDDYHCKDGPALPIRSAYYGYGRRYPRESLQAAVRWGRFNGLGCSWRGWFNHSSAQALSDRYVETHPEYYALIRGRRIVPKKNERARWKICHSNLDLPALFAEWGMKHPDGKDFFPVSPNDGHNWCECDECRKLDAGQQAKFDNLSDPLCTSGRVFTLADRVARELEKRGSKQLVAVYAYSSHTDPPAILPKLHDQVLVAVAKGIPWKLVPEEEKKFDELMRLWADRAKNVLLRDYPGVGRTGITPYPRLAACTVKSMYHTFRNFHGIDNCGDDSRSYALWGPTQYVLAHLLWMPEADAEKLLDDYYGSGWPKSQKWIRAYFDYFEKRTAEIRRHGKNQWPGNLLGCLEVMSDSAIAHGRELLAKAAETAKDNEAELSRVEFIRTGLEFAALDAAYYRALIAAGAIHGIPQSGGNADRLTVLRNAKKIIAERKAFLEKHRDCEGIPSAVAAFLAGNSSAENDVELKYQAALKQPPSEEISLAGDWRFMTWNSDAEKNFVRSDLDDSNWKLVTTNAPWEKQGFPGYNGWGYYRRRVMVPESWKDGRILLILGAVDESYRLYCDGRFIQEYRYTKDDPDAWLTERRIDLTKELTPGPHLIAVAVHDSGGDGGIWRPAALHLERPNLLPGNHLETLRDAACHGKEITRDSRKKSFSFRGLLRWAKPGRYRVLLSFTPKSSGSVTMRINTRTENKWHPVAETPIHCVSGERQDIVLPVTVEPGSVGLNAIISARLAGMTLHAFKITSFDQTEEIKDNGENQ